LWCFASGKKNFTPAKKNNLGKLGVKRGKTFVGAEGKKVEKRSSKAKAGSFLGASI